MTKKSRSTVPNLVPTNAARLDPLFTSYGTLVPPDSELVPARLAAHTRSRRQLGSNFQVRRVGG